MSDVVWSKEFENGWNASVLDKNTFGVLCLKKGTKKFFEKMIVPSNGKDLDVEEWQKICKEYIRKSEKA